MSYKPIKIESGLNHKGSYSLSEVLDNFQDRGFAVIKPGSERHSRHCLLSLTTVFGPVKMHELSDPKGIVEIYPNRKRGKFGDAFTCRKMEVHTDGAFLPSPPNVVALQCEVQAKTGGSNLLVDGKSLYRFLSKHYVRDLEYLFSDKAMSISRHQTQAEQAVFARVSDRIQVTFRYDDSVNATFAANVSHLIPVIKEFLENSGNQKVISLEQGDILIIDNKRILHGRSDFTFETRRKMNRVWFNGDLNQKIDCGFRVDDLTHYSNRQSMTL
jgi:alpha-ketoglutarate-dependent taurine dioxygenase